MHFFDISTSKNVPRMFCFVHSDFEMCFAPQRRAIFNLSSGRMAPHPAALALASRLFDPPEPQIILVYWCIGRACQLLLPVLCGLSRSDSPIHQYTTPQLQLQLQLHYTNYCTLHYSYNSITLHYNYNCNCTTPHYIQQLWVRSGEVTIATVAATPKNTTPTTFQSISGFALPSVHHNNSPLL